MLTSPDLNLLRILVVDDRPAVCDVVTRLLSRLGIGAVHSANDGATALSRIEHAADRYDVAIFDIDMPTDDGLVCIRKLAKLPDRPAVVLMSGKDPLVLESARRLGEDLGVTILGTLHKPITSAGLKAALQALDRAAVSVPEPRQSPLAARDVERAIDEQWFELWFQPQLHLADGRIHGVEALLRLRHPDLGILKPESFIKTAEDHGLIRPLTDMVLQQAVGWCAEWRAAGHTIAVSLNLSKAGLDDLSLPDRAAAVCRARCVPTGQIVIELTESSLVADHAAVLDILTRLRLKGFRISLDDFGTGYASLEELRSLPFHELKLDKQFVQHAEHNERTLMILGNSVKLAREMGLSIVAEGIETEAMLQLVASLGCQAAQGYFIGRPMPAGEVLPWIRNDGANRQPSASPAAGVSAAAGEGPSLVSTDMLRRFAHDAASPLMIVLGVTEGLLDDPRLSAEQRSDLTSVQAAAQELANMLRTFQKRVRESDQRETAIA